MMKRETKKKREEKNKKIKHKPGLAKVKIMEKHHHHHHRHQRVKEAHYQIQKIHRIQKKQKTKPRRQDPKWNQRHRNRLQGMLHKGSTVMTRTQRIRRRMQQPAVQQNQHPHLPLQVAAVIMSKIRQMRMMLKALKDNTTALKLAIPTLFQLSVRQHHKQPPPLKQIIRRHMATVTASPRSPTPPPLFCFFFFLLRVRLLLRWPRESEGERAVHRPHTHSSFTLSLCVSPCMDSRPHLTPRGTHTMCPLYICMHTHAGPLVLSFARHALLPSCLAAWVEHRNCFCFHCIEWATSLSPCVCVLLYGSNESVCAGRPTLRLFLVLLVFCLSAPIPRAACVCLCVMI
ncbi:hypothetical protein ECC02_009371 [Trypanosoma cruzi]|uniref:Uncharacterized protein n=1 Tax=Trypanosoma cruzi TaxID=5693 RepID=A0A7J6XV48_TRYCR|nr:hypothetical protein ECC02_009371 [Trypanosoma cruzi]